jgi:hypothetical protein
VLAAASSRQAVAVRAVRSLQGFAVELGGQDLVFGGHAPSLRHTAHARASYLREFYRLANSEEGMK